jgi:hypothetical protein
VTCGTTTCYFIAQSFNNQGTVVAYGVGGSPNYSTGGGGGGTAGGGVVVIAHTAAIGTINVNGSPGGAGVTATGASTVAGPGGGSGVFLLLSGMSVPVGGTAPGCATGIYGFPCYNGGGGGVGQFLGGCDAGSATVYSFANGNDLVTYVIQGVSDWWLSNVVGKAPPSVTPLPMVQGGGGSGGQGANATGAVGGGGGGGGGGEVVIYGYNVIAGTIDAAGGVGGTSCTTGGCCTCTAGGGGGGGIVLVFYGPGGLNGTMSVNVAGGSGGEWSTGSYASAGSNGTYYAGSVTVNG